jgi:hypothetical protein
MVSGERGMLGLELIARQAKTTMTMTTETRMTTMKRTPRVAESEARRLVERLYGKKTKLDNPVPEARDAGSASEFPRTVTATEVIRSVTYENDPHPQRRLR